MKKKNINDERLIFQKRKIGSDAYAIISLGLIVSAIIQQYVFQAPFSQYVVELILFLIGTIYIVLRNIMAGNDLFDDGNKVQKTIIINSIVSGLTIAIITITSNIINLGLEKMGNTITLLTIFFITFLCGAGVSIICFAILSFINKKGQKAIAIKYDDSDE